MSRVKLSMHYPPGLIHHTDKKLPNLKRPKVDLKNEMRKSGGMLGDRSLELGIFQEMISYSCMPLTKLKAAQDDKLSPKEQAELEGYKELLHLGLRPSESVIDSWLKGYGQDRASVFPDFKKEYDFELAIWKAKEAEYQSLIKNPTPELAHWMSKLNITPSMLEKPLVNPFQIDQEAYIPPELLLRQRDMGLHMLKAPEEYGGFGFNQKKYDATLRALISETYSGAIAGRVSAHSTIGQLIKYGTEAQKKYFYPQIIQGDYDCAFGLTERASGTDAIDGAETIATLSADGKNWVLNGGKIFITNTQRAGLMYIMAKVDDGSGDLKPTTFLLELPFKITDSKEDMKKNIEFLKTKGIYISNPLDLMMIRGSNQAYIEFHNAQIPVFTKKVVDRKEIEVEAVLGGKEGIGKGTAQIFGGLNAGRAAFGAFCAEGAALALNLACMEVAQRIRFKKLFGGPLGNLPYIRKTLSKMAVQVAAINAASDLITSVIDKYPKMNVIAEAALIKAYASDMAIDVIRDAAKICGGLGTMKGQIFELMFRDMWIPLIVEGANEAMYQQGVAVSAKAALNESKTLGGSLKVATSFFFNYDFGRGLKFWDALSIQKATKGVAFNALKLGALNKEKTMLKQNELISIGKKEIKVFALAATYLRIQDKIQQGNLSLKEEAALKQFIENVNSGRESYPEHIAELYLEDAVRLIGLEKKRNAELLEKYSRVKV